MPRTRDAPSQKEALPKDIAAVWEALCTSEAELVRVKSQLTAAQETIGRQAVDIAALNQRASRLAPVEAQSAPPIAKPTDPNPQAQGPSADEVELRSRIAAMEASTSWKITRPLRGMLGALRS